MDITVRLVLVAPGQDTISQVEAEDTKQVEAGTPMEAAPLVEARIIKEAEVMLATDSKPTTEIRAIHRRGRHTHRSLAIHQPPPYRSRCVDAFDATFSFISM